VTPDIFHPGQLVDVKFTVCGVRSKGKTNSKLNIFTELRTVTLLDDELTKVRLGRPFIILH
jgi:hypothetical protein